MLRWFFLKYCIYFFFSRIYIEVILRKERDCIGVYMGMSRIMWNFIRIFSIIWNLNFGNYLFLIFFIVFLDWGYRYVIGIMKYEIVVI